MRSAIISGVGAVGFAIVGWAMPIVFPQVDPLVGQAMLAVGLLLLLTAFILWIRNRKANGNGQSIVGNDNVQIGTARDVTIGSSAADLAREIELQRLRRIEQQLESARVIERMIAEARRSSDPPGEDDSN